MFAFAVLILIPALTHAQPDHDLLERRLFWANDANHDSKISQLENEAFILSFDTDHDTQVSKAEFTVALDKLETALIGHEDVLFTLMDHNTDGHIDKDDIDAAFTQSDHNGDGYIDHQEFHVSFHIVLNHIG